MGVLLSCDNRGTTRIAEQKRFTNSFKNLAFLHKVSNPYCCFKTQPSGSMTGGAPE